MTTPIKDFTDAYSRSGIIRAHMPGHKGHGENAPDITEIKGADSLFEADGIIAESEKNASDIFGSCKTIYSAGGSTLCIQTMLTMCIGISGSKKIVAARNCHRAFISACAFLDADVEWVYPEYESTIVSGKITADMIESAMIRAGAPACVYITSPDYLGKMTELDDIAAVCRKYGTILAVDNAHGAYLRFIKDESGRPVHPLYHGANICCDSAHKTLPVLTGGAYLHINDPRLEKYDGYAKEIMSMYGSSSPSYLILRSLDMCNGYMNTHAESDFAQMRALSEQIKEELSPVWHFEDGECGKLTIFAPPSGYYGYELADALRRKNIECEYADASHCVLMLTGLYPQEIMRIKDALIGLPQPRILIRTPDIGKFPPPERVMSIREAAFAPSESIPADEAAGRICARAVSCCPPGIAIVVNGEIFTREAINILKNYSIFQVNVVK